MGKNTRMRAFQWDNRYKIIIDTKQKQHATSYRDHPLHVSGPLIVGDLAACNANMTSWASAGVALGIVMYIAACLESTSTLVLCQPGGKPARVCTTQHLWRLRQAI